MMWRCYLYLKDSEYMLDGDLSEPRRGGGHSGILILHAKH